MDYPSIFNDVIGPVMVGPSSSHTAASQRIGLTLRNLCGKDKPVKFSADFDPNGSLATTYHTQCSDIGLVGGLMGFAADDARLPRSLEIARENGLDITFNIVDYGAKHPNTYRMRVETESGKNFTATAISTGGGMFELIEFNGFAVSISGGFSVVLAEFENEMPCFEWALSDENYVSHCIIENGERKLVVINSLADLDVPEGFSVTAKDIVKTEAVLPIRSQRKNHVPFLTAEECLTYAREHSITRLSNLALRYESERGGITEDEVLEMMEHIIDIVENAIKKGLRGTEYADRLLHQQAKNIKPAFDAGRLLGGGLTSDLVTNVAAIMEVKSAFGTVVAAPTAGSCGGLPGTVMAAVKERGLTKTDAARAMLAAGLVGVFIAHKSTFAAEVCGCQAECGCGSGMAAAGLCDLMGADVMTALNAASMSLQNIFGMVCDPVAARVEVPCLGKNIMAGMNAVACANMAVAGFDAVIPLDETIDAMDAVGRMLPRELRCTALGGLSVTETSRTLEYRLQENS